MKQRILVIRLSAMGDVAMSSIVVRALVNQHPDVEIIVLSKPFLKPIFKDIDNVTFYAAETKGKHKGILGLYKLYQELKKLEIDKVVDLHNVLRSKILRLFFWNTKKAVLNKGRKEKAALTRTTNKIFKQLKSMHQRYADVFKELGFEVDLSKVKFSKPTLLTSEIKKSIDVDIKENENCIGIAPFAQYTSKTYPLDLMEKVILQLSKKKGFKIFLFGGGKEQTKILLGLENKYTNVISVAGKMKLCEELVLISNLKCMLSMDSGNAHFSSMYGVPTLTLWGGTHPFAGFYPFHQPKENAFLPDLEKYPKIPYSIYGNKILPGYEDAMRSISPYKIVQKVVEIVG